MSHSTWRTKNPLVSFRHAVEGLGHAFRTQRNMRFHILTFLVVFLAGLILRLPRVEMLALVFCAALVMITEMFNTAIEATVDMITQSYHPAAKFIKDVAAGAVLISAITAVLVGAVVFWGAIRPDTLSIRLVQPPTVPVFLGAFVLLLLIVFLGKIAGRKGSLLQGGVISGHSAIAFYIAGVIVFLVPQPAVGLLALGLAALVAQSRVEAKIHTLREVVAGAVIALTLAALVLKVPQWLGFHLPTTLLPVSTPSPQPSPK
jgi:diacylglycerol kinase (ATP)